jgi:hypothetical protein
LVTTAKKYLWNFEIIHYDDDSLDFTAPVVIGTRGKDGADGVDGVDGIDGKDGADGVDGDTGTKTEAVRAYYLTNSTSNIGKPSEEGAILLNQGW